MGQSKDVLKQHASVVTKSVDDDGLAVALVDYFDLDAKVLSLTGSRATHG
ncbi:MAG: HAD family hydrolase [Brevibacterium aurantiacum]|nr:HAD family hydrolase [Brevibacterium aurantiacum]